MLMSLISARVCRRALSRFASSGGAAFEAKYGVFVNGKYAFPTGCKTFKVENPATSEYVADVVAADEATVVSAIDAAHNVFESGLWSRSDVRHRAKVLSTIAEMLRREIPRLAEMEVAQTGRAVREMKAQLARLPEWFEYFAAIIRTHEGTVPVRNDHCLVNRLNLSPSSILINSPMILLITLFINHLCSYPSHFWVHM